MALDNAYIPTAAEEKLLEVIANPDHFGKNVTERCKLAGVTRTTFYDAMQKRGFVDYYNGLMLNLIRSSVGDIITATIKFGTKSKANSADRRILLEMAGIYAPRVVNEITGEGGGPLRIEFGVTRPERPELEAGQEIKTIEAKVID